eukprot:12584980-Alexandrium_andersonii.AAC.1
MPWHLQGRQDMTISSLLGRGQIRMRRERRGKWDIRVQTCVRALDSCICQGAHLRNARSPQYPREPRYGRQGGGRERHVC